MKDQRQWKKPVMMVGVHKENIFRGIEEVISQQIGTQRDFNLVSDTVTQMFLQKLFELFYPIPHMLTEWFGKKNK